MATITTYCVRGDVQKILSAAGAALRADDDPDAARWACEEAALDINEYCLRRYSATTLAANAWVTRKAAWLAAYKLCQRRANKVPEPIKDEVDGKGDRPGLMARLDEVRRGLRHIPDAAERKADVPVLTNQRVGLRPFPLPRNSQGTSTGNPEGYQPLLDNDGYLGFGL